MSSAKRTEQHINGALRFYRSAEPLADRLFDSRVDVGHLVPARAAAAEPASGKDSGVFVYVRAVTRCVLGCVLVRVSALQCVAFGSYQQVLLKEKGVSQPKQAFVSRQLFAHGSPRSKA